MNDDVKDEVMQIIYKKSPIINPSKFYWNTRIRICAILLPSLSQK
jgi:hypothetical protein